METLLTNQIVSMTELREPAKVLSQANGKPVAVMNRNQVVGYFVPIEAVESIKFEDSSLDRVKDILSKRLPAVAKVLKYLEDK